MPEENQLGNMLASFRKRKGGWNQVQTAEWLKVARHTYSDWETGKRFPSPEKLKYIATKFELSQEEEDALYRAAAHVPLITDNLPPRNPFFTGRETHLERLGNLLQETGTAAITQSVSISGLGGIGKTQLALEYAHSCYSNVYRVVLWVNAADETMLQGSYVKLAAQTLRLPELNEREPDRSVQAVKRWLATHTNWLLIMDNADDLPLARSFLPGKPLGHVVFTTRSQIIGTTARRGKHIEVEVMEPEQGLLFLLLRSGVLEDETKLYQVTADIRETALEVVKLLGGHPLALDQAGAYIVETGVSFNDYVKRYQEERPYILNRRGSLKADDSEHPEAVAVTFKLSFIKAFKRSPLITGILSFCAFLHPDAIPEELFQHYNSFKYDTTAFDEGIAALHRYSLIKRNKQEKTLSMHRLVQAVLLDAMSPDLQRQWREYVVGAVHAAFPEVNYKNWGQCGRLLPHALVCASWTKNEFTSTVDTAELFHLAGLYLRGQGQYSAAETLLGQAGLIYVQHLGVEHLYTISTLINLASLFSEQGKHSQAEPLYWQALSIQEKQLGAEHPDTASTLYGLAVLYFSQGNVREAAGPLLLKALSIQEKHLGSEHPDTARSQILLAAIHYVHGNDAQAELLYRQQITIQEKHLGDEHPDIALTLLGLAVILHNQGKLEQADTLYQRALSIQEQQLGATHPRTEQTKEDYAKFLRSIGRDAEAAALEIIDGPSL